MGPPQSKPLKGTTAKPTSDSHKKKLKKELRGIKSNSPSYFIGKSSKRILTTYTFEKLLGKGSYGEVYVGVHKISGERRAIKQIHKERLIGINEDIMHEFNILKQLDHPTITKVYEAYEDVANIYIINELYECGDLFSYMRKCTFFNEKVASNITKQILLALAYCHQNIIAHRDLKPQNIMVKEEATMRVKLIDFGFAKYYKDETKMDEQLGTPIFMAPEIIQKHPYDCKVDIWSLGVIVFSMLTGDVPFSCTSKASLFHSITSFVASSKCLPSYCSPEANDFIVKTMDVNPKNRLSAEELLKHPWIMSKSDMFCGWGDDIGKKVKDNILNLSGRTALQDAIFTYLAVNSDKLKSSKQIQELFLKLDANKDGHISKSEFSMGLRNYPHNLNLSVFELDNIFDKIDSDKSGFIEYTEFLKAVADRNELVTDAKLKSAFDYLDIDGNGYINAVELSFLFQKGTGSVGKSIELIIADGDVDKDGKISFEELKKLMKKGIY